MKRFTFSDVPDFDLLIVQVSQELKRRGIQNLTLTTRHGDEHQFEVRSHNISFVDHGSPNPDKHCILCPREPRLRFEFTVTDLQGVEVGPIGSTCIFKNVLGEKENRKISQQLKTTAEEVAHLHQQKELLQRVNHRYLDYLKDLGFMWATEPQGDRYLLKHLSTRVYDQVVGTMRSRAPLPLKVHKTLAALTESRKQATPPTPAPSPAPQTAAGPRRPSNLPLELFEYYQQHEPEVLTYLTPRHRLKFQEHLREQKTTPLSFDGLRWLKAAIHAHQNQLTPYTQVPRNLPPDIASRWTGIGWKHMQLNLGVHWEVIEQHRRLNIPVWPDDALEAFCAVARQQFFPSGQKKRKKGRFNRR